MTNLSTKAATFLILLLLGPTLSASELAWPTKENIDIYHGFGEFRPNRYHAGLDIRTGGRPGRKVYSPVDGYLYRVKMAYNGYGKGLYIMGDDGKIYVYGHLQDFSLRIDSTVKAVQRSTKRYFMDKYYPKDSVRVSAGELIALTGQTGAGAPHLHFEVRDTEAIPINPLLAGLSLNDKFKPTLERIGFQYTDTLSLFENRERRLYSPVTKDRKGVYQTGEIRYFSHPFGLLVDGFDQSAYNGIKQAVYKYSITLDGQPYYDVTFDSLDFGKGRTVNYNYDYQEASLGHKRARRLFKMTGNNYSGVVDHNHDRGIIRFDTTAHRVDLHHADITAEDVYGNKATAGVDFIWGPEHIYRVDSLVSIAMDTAFFYLSAPENIEGMQIDSIVPYKNEWAKWERLSDARLQGDTNGKFRLKVFTGPAETLTLRFAIYTTKGVIYDEPFSGHDARLLKRPFFEWQIVDDGLAVTVHCFNVKQSVFYLRALDGDKIVGAYRPISFVNMREYRFFIPASDRIERITALDASSSPDDPTVRQEREAVNIFLLGKEKRTISSDDGLFQVAVSPRDLYAPTFITIEEDSTVSSDRRLVSKVYKVNPDAFITLSNFDISATIDTSTRWSERAGLCWYDEGEAEWVWLNRNEMEDFTVESESMGGGQFGVLLDRRKPSVQKLNLRNDVPISTTLPQIKFEIDEDLSGITEDTSIVITIDGEWLIPEYDPETGVCITKPNHELTDGKHTLKIELTDRAGNMSKRTMSFQVMLRN